MTSFPACPEVSFWLSVIVHKYCTLGYAEQTEMYDAFKKPFSRDDDLNTEFDIQLLFYNSKKDRK